MIFPNELDAALIAALKANSALTAYLTARSSANEIRHREWQGRDLQYPLVRIDSGTETPIADSHCYTSHSNLAFRIYVESEQDSQQECNELGRLVNVALFGQKLTGIGFTTNSIANDGTPGATRTGEGVWRMVIPYRMGINGGIP